MLESTQNTFSFNLESNSLWVTQLTPFNKFGICEFAELTQGLRASKQQGPNWPPGSSLLPPHTTLSSWTFCFVRITSLLCSQWALDMRFHSLKPCLFRCPILYNLNFMTIAQTWKQMRLKHLKGLWKSQPIKPSFSQGWFKMQSNG